MRVGRGKTRVTGVDISGRLKLQFAIGRNYPKEHTFVSSAPDRRRFAGTRYRAVFATGMGQCVSDAQRGEPILARTNVKDYPIGLASNGAITERWLIKFITATQFELYGERLGLVAKSDTLTDLAPTNPATGKPYFTLRRPHSAAAGRRRTVSASTPTARRCPFGFCAVSSLRRTSKTAAMVLPRVCAAIRWLNKDKAV